MKIAKRICAFMLACALALSLCLSAFAADEPRFTDDDYNGAVDYCKQFLTEFYDAVYLGTEHDFSKYVRSELFLEYIVNKYEAKRLYTIAKEVTDYSFDVSFLIESSIDVWTMTFTEKIDVTYSDGTKEHFEDARECIKVTMIDGEYYLLDWVSIDDEYSENVRDCVGTASYNESFWDERTEWIDIIFARQEKEHERLTRYWTNVKNGIIDESAKTESTLTQADYNEATALAEEFLRRYYDLSYLGISSDMSDLCGYDKFAEYVKDRFGLWEMRNRIDNITEDYELTCTVSEQKDVDGSVMLRIGSYVTSGSGGSGECHLFIISKMDGEYKIVDWAVVDTAIRHDTVDLRHPDYWADDSLMADYWLKYQTEHNEETIARWLKNAKKTYEDMGLEEPVEACLEETE